MNNINVRKEQLHITWSAAVLIDRMTLIVFYAKVNHRHITNSSDPDKDQEMPNKAIIAKHDYYFVLVLEQSEPK